MSETLRDLISRQIELPAGRGPYIEHVIDEGHRPDEPCDICAALAIPPVPAGEPRCPHGSWQGTYCPHCGGNRAVFGAQRGVPPLTPPVPAEDERVPCWFCKTPVPIEALIAGYDTFDEQRLACLACDERMQGNWRPLRSPVGVLPCLVQVDGGLASDVLIAGSTYRVAETREHWEPSGVKGEPPKVTTVIRFDPVAAAGVRLTEGSNQTRPAQAWTGCGCTADAELFEGGSCPACGHRDHGRGGCSARVLRTSEGSNQ